MLLQRSESRASIEGPYPLTAQRLVDIFTSGSRNDANVAVNANTVTGLSAAYHAIDVNAKAWATVPKTVVKTADDTALEQDRYTSLVETPGDLIPGFNWWELAGWHRFVHGNFVGIKVRDRGVGRVTAIAPTDPTNWRQVGVYSGARRIDVMWETVDKEGNIISVPSEDIFHIMGPSMDGMWGMSPIVRLANMFGTQIAAESYAGKLFGNGSLMSGILTTDKRLTEPQASALKQRWRAKMTGLSNAHDIAVLDNGADFKSLTIPPNEAQFLESRAFGVYEIGRVYGVPPLLMQVQGRDTQGQLTEQVMLQFAKTQLQPELTRAAAPWSVVLPEGAKLKFHVQDYIVTDERTKSSAAVMWRQSKVKSINELRAEQGLPPLADEEASDPLSDIGGKDQGGSDPGDNAGNEDPLGDVTKTPTKDTDRSAEWNDLA